MIAAALEPTREEGARWAWDELQDPEYSGRDLTFFEKVYQFLADLFFGIVDSTFRASNAWWLIGVGLLLVALVWFIVWRVRRFGGGGLSLPPVARPLFETTPDPRLLRQAAEQAAAEQDWQAAVQHRLRALIAEFGRARLIALDPAATATELAAAAAAALPEHGTGVVDAAELFDRVTFGRVPASADDYHGLVELDDTVRQAVTRRSRQTRAVAVGGEQS